jgi:gas vesicle protein
MTSAIDFAAATRTTRDALTTTLNTWKDGVKTVTDQFRVLPAVASLPQVDVTDAVERQFAFIQQIVDLNHQYARQLAEVANTLSGVTRQQIESVSGVVRERVQGAAELTQTTVDTVEQSVREQADEAQEAANKQVREAAKAERLERKEAEEKARAPYANLTRAQLSEQAAKRDLPKTGTVDELIDRLVEHDSTGDSK